MLNRAQEAAAKTGNSTTTSLVSTIRVKSRLHILHILFEYYYTSFILIVFKLISKLFS
jgi:hypothetical protein